MNESGIQVKTIEQPRPTPPDAMPGRRLLVLISGPEIDPVLTANRVRDLAIALQAGIRFIGLYPAPDREPALRRQLVDLTVMVSDGRQFAESEAAPAKAWLETIRSRWQAGDVVVCFACQRLDGEKRPLSSVLEEALDTPIFILSRLEPQKAAPANLLTRFAAWAGSFAILFGFLMLQVRIDPSRQDWIYYTLFALSLAAEVAALWIWNSRFD
jgi:hypothetical protein